MRAHQKHFGNYTTDWNVYLDAGQDYYYRLPFDYNESLQKITPEEVKEPYLRIKVDYPLMVRILDRKAHWNNAEIGSHLRYFRKPNEFVRTIHFLLSYLQC
jgi:UDP-MurNAc hydroxylase